MLLVKDSWVSAPLEELLAHVIGGDWGKAEDSLEDGFESVSCIRGSEFKHWRKELGSTAVIRKIKSSSLTTRKLTIGDVLIEISGGGPEQPVGRTVLITEQVLEQLSYPAVCTNFLRLARPSEYINSSYLNYYLTKFYYSGEVVNYQGGSNNLRNLKFKEYSRIEIPLPSLAEQKIIAEKLDTLLAQVENTKARLERIPRILKQFRQSVLAAAVSGKLTEEWRGGFHMLGEKLILACTAEREKGKKVKKAIELEEAPNIQLPESWTWLTLDQCSQKITDGTHHSPKSYPSGDFMYVTSKNVREGYIDLRNISYVDKETHKEIYSRCDVICGDVLYVKDGANAGLACVSNFKEEVSLLSSVGVVRLVSLVNSQYCEYYLNSPIGRKLMLGMMGGTAIPRLTITKIRKGAFPLPPFEEQTEIIQQVQKLFTFADKIEKQTQNALAKVNNLSQSILAKAFKGELTADWRAANPELISGENSAEALLQRIKEEREKLKPVKKAKTKATRKKA